MASEQVEMCPWLANGLAAICSAPSLWAHCSVHTKNWQVSTGFQSGISSLTSERPIRLPIPLVPRGTLAALPNPGEGERVWEVFPLFAGSASGRRETRRCAFPKPLWGAADAWGRQILGGETREGGAPPPDTHPGRLPVKPRGPLDREERREEGMAVMGLTEWSASIVGCLSSHCPLVKLCQSLYTDGWFQSFCPIKPSKLTIMS